MMEIGRNGNQTAVSTRHQTTLRPLLMMGDNHSSHVHKSQWAGPSRCHALGFIGIWAHVFSLVRLLCCSCESFVSHLSSDPVSTDVYLCCFPCCCCTWVFGIAAAQSFWFNSSISKKKNTKIYIWCMLQCFKAFFCYLFINRYLSLLHMSGLCMHLHAWLSIFHRGMWLLSLMWKIRKKKMQGANHLWRWVEVVLVVFAIETFATYWKDSEKNYVLSIYLSN